MLGVVAAVVSNCAIGFLFYNGKVPTGQFWMRRAFPGKSSSDVASGMGSALGLTMVSNILMTLLLKFILVDFFTLKTVLDALKFTIGLSSLTTLLEIPHVLFSKRYLDAFLLDQLYNTIVMVVAAACLFYLK